ncbi:MAG: hypothetical protein KGJ58_00955 [Patescibacteria group bacterium]|nr:hypothetical protein [Patescibacteria group bacterium]MDE1988131.1 hypothetical protein [Patescibacteria group bacterium]MDE2218010.1 hypothetical protein [Patescibacteria group bacterium]
MKIFRISSLIALAFLLLFSLIPSAKAGPPYGGRAIFTIPCVCSARLWIYFDPLYLSSSFPTSGALEYSFATRLYEHYNIGAPGAWHLGDYTKSSRCYIYTGKSCSRLPSSGLMTKAGIGFPL